MKIAKIKELIATARIIDDSKLNTEEVQLLNKVTIKNTANGVTADLYDSNRKRSRSP